MVSFGKLLVVFGLLMVCLGVLLVFYDKIPFLGKLLGDVNIKKDNFQFYFLITTSVIISVLLSLILWLISFLSRK